MKIFHSLMEARNKKSVRYLTMLLAVGILMMVLGRFFTPPLNQELRDNLQPDEIYNGRAQTEDNPGEISFEKALENRLEEMFSLVEGAGRVRVMINPFLGGGEMVFAVDTDTRQSITKEEDAQGGTRESRQYTNQEQTVIITDRSGVDHPLVLREVQPRIEGIVIIAEGGQSPFVQDALTRAARAVLGIDAHKIQVLQMAS